MSQVRVRLFDGERHCYLVGKTVTARGTDRSVAAFLGIPYAKPPVGIQRFQPPQECELWSGVREALKHGSACPQDMKRVLHSYGHLPFVPKVFDEDCLYLNIWSPDVTTGPRLPVMVWIHGGAFVQGFSNIYDGTPLAAYENVIVISINYRVGVFGFLHTGSGPGDYHGNQGLLDQLAALRWVQKHISSFGGDPDNVTVFGQSAGGMSTSFHLVSPLAAGLFRRVIIHSGSGVSPGSVWPQGGAQKYWWKRIHAMGYKGTGGPSLVEFLQTKSQEDLLAAFNDWFVPTVQDGKYLSEFPFEAFQKDHFHHVDCMIGFNTSEGVEYVPTEIPDRPSAEQAIWNLAKNSFFRGYPEDVVRRICDLVITHYLTSDNFVSDVCDFQGDAIYVAPSIRQAEYHSEKACLYMYQFDHRPFYSQHPPWVRADHSNEIPYVFGYPFDERLPDIWTDEDRNLSKVLMKYWANFAKTGNPNGSDCEQTIWHQFTPGGARYLHILTDIQESCCIKELKPDKIKMWNEMVPQLLQQAETKSKY